MCYEVGMKSVYVHFPFCESKCNYCDFYSIGLERTRKDDFSSFKSALRREAELVAHLLAPELDTIFFGGGTPSLTNPESMAFSLEPLWQKTTITPQTEWTMEANPSSIINGIINDKCDRESPNKSIKRMKAYCNLGINRLSMGVQTLQPELLSKLGRVHSREEALLALHTVFEAGFENVSVDLLCGVPGQTLESLEDSLNNLTKFPISHLSCYLLTLPPHHQMFAELPPEDEQLRHLLFIDEWLSTMGFEHYEISNFAKPGKRSRHNTNYWKGASYLGLGPSAHSFDSRAGKRWKNISSIHTYAAKLNKNTPPKNSPNELPTEWSTEWPIEWPTEWNETLTEEQRDLEKWLLALRLEEGFPESWIDTSTRRERVESFKNEGLIIKHPTFKSNYRLTARGFALSDQIISALSS